MDSHFLTSHAIARLLGVSASAVLSWIDRGWLHAHRTPGGHRRVEPKELRRFLIERGMPLPVELSLVRRLLVIDDDPAFLRSVERILELEAPDLVVKTAMGAIDGLLLVGTFNPDAILLDAFMPGMDGLEACRRIRGGAATQHIRIIAVTGCASPELTAQFQEAGAIACLSKPLRAEQLLDGLEYPHSERASKRERT